MEERKLHLYNQLRYKKKGKRKKLGKEQARYDYYLGIDQTSIMKGVHYFVPWWPGETRILVYTNSEITFTELLDGGNSLDYHSC